MGIAGIKEAKGHKITQHHQRTVQCFTGNQIRIHFRQVTECLLTATITKAKEQEQEAGQRHDTALNNGCCRNPLQTTECSQHNYHDCKGNETDPIGNSGHDFKKAAASDKLRSRIVADKDK